MMGKRATIRPVGRLADRMRRRHGGPEGTGILTRRWPLFRRDPGSSGPALGAAVAGRESVRDRTGSLIEGWRWAGILLGLGTVGLISLFRSTTWPMVETWSSSQSFSHGFAIAPICAYLLWLRRRELARVAPRPSLWGVAFAAAAAFAWLIGDLAGVRVVEQFAVVAMIQGLFLAVVGFSVARIAKFPLLYLYFAVPVGLFLVPPLQDFTAQFVVRMLRFTGIPVHLDGIFLQIPSGMFEVAEACAGVRFLITSVALGVLFAYLMYRQLWRRVTFIALSVLVPIVANGFRAYGIVILAHYSDYQIAANADHITYGLIFLSLVFFLLLGFGMLLREPRGTSDQAKPQIFAGRAAERTPSLAIYFAAAMAVMLVAWGASAYAGYVAHRLPDNVTVTLRAPDAAAPWVALSAADTTWRPRFIDPDAELFRSYTDGNRQVELYVAYYAHQRQGTEVVHALNDFVGATPWERAGSGTADAAADGQDFTVAYTRIRSPSRRRLVWHWYWVDGQFTANPIVAKLLEVRAKLTGGEPAAAAIGLAADYRDRPDEATSAIKDLLDRLGPIGAALERSSRLSVDG